MSTYKNIKNEDINYTVDYFDTTDEYVRYYHEDRIVEAALTILDAYINDVKTCRKARKVMVRSLGRACAHFTIFGEFTDPLMNKVTIDLEKAAEKDVDLGIFYSRVVGSARVLLEEAGFDEGYNVSLTVTID